jgi:hypothetical protein
VEVRKASDKQVSKQASKQVDLRVGLCFPPNLNKPTDSNQLPLSYTSSSSSSSSSFLSEHTPLLFYTSHHPLISLLCHYADISSMRLYTKLFKSSQIHLSKLKKNELCLEENRHLVGTKMFSMLRSQLRLFFFFFFLAEMELYCS